MSKAVFLAFTGPEIEQATNIVEIADRYECWNLKKFTLDEFVTELKIKIPPINNNVLRNYKLVEESADIWGITEEKFKICSWGLFIPDGIESALTNSYAETNFLINLYSPTFLYPVFYGSDFGITRSTLNKKLFHLSHLQNQSKNFSKKEFVTFFKTLLPQSQYGVWQLDRIQKWDAEDWRLFSASHLYFGLQDYDNHKSSFGWQRESADMGVILEALFTAGDAKNEDVGYRLRKRIAVLLSHKFSEIEADIKKLYSKRSAFVHGSFFAQIAKESKTSFNNIPSPDFDILYRQKEYVRWALVGCLFLAKEIKDRPNDYKNNKSVMSVLERAIIDTDLRNTILVNTNTIFSLLPIADIKIN